MADVDYKLQGQNGGLALSGTGSWFKGQNGASEPHVRWIQFLEDSTVSSITSNIVDLETVLPALAPIPAGTSIGGQTTAITLGSGSVVLYY